MIRVNFTSRGRHAHEWIFAGVDSIPVLDANGVAAVTRLMEEVADQEHAVVDVA